MKLNASSPFSITLLSGFAELIGVGHLAIDYFGFHQTMPNFLGSFAAVMTLHIVWSLSKIVLSIIASTLQAIVRCQKAVDGWRDEQASRFDNAIYRSVDRGLGQIRVWIRKKMRRK